MFKLLVTVLTVCIVGCDFGITNQENAEPTTLEMSTTRDDSLYVIDNYNYSARGNRKPPCSASPNFCGCMESRIKALGVDIILDGDCQ